MPEGTWFERPVRCDLRPTVPRRAVPFSGSFFVEGPETDGSGRGEGSFQRTASIQFWPDWSDVEVRVVIEDSTMDRTTYENWRHEGNLATPGQRGPRPLRLRATLQPKAENPTPEQLQALPPVRRFRFELSNIASSEYRTSGDYSASRATGAPDVTRSGDSLKAWASRLADSGPEWLERTYSNAVVATAVRVRQVFNPGAIQRIELLEAAGSSSTVFSGVDTNLYPSGQIAWFVVNFAPTAQPVKRVRLSLDSARVKGWNEIDAVQLVAASTSPPPAPRLLFTYQATTGTLEIPAWPAGFILQGATRMAPADWQNHAVLPPVSVPAGGSPAFFRLIQAP